MSADDRSMHNANWNPCFLCIS